MTRLIFYYDPLCPWSWLTSLWIREARKQRPIEVEWRFFSLAKVNKRDPVRYGPLRIAALARRERGNEGADLAYLALGRAIHEQHITYNTPQELAERVQAALGEVGLDPALAPRALEDESTLDDVLHDHEEAVERFGAFGVPWLVTEDRDFGFFGPVVNQMLSPDEAGELWDHYLWMGSRPYLYEIKRDRGKLPDLSELSTRFIWSDQGSG